MHLLLALTVFLSTSLQAAELRVATASNFLATLRVLAPMFERETGIELKISAASTGKLYAQIRHGAPYDVFLAADARRPQLLEQQGLALAGSRFTYARGQLVLWRSTPDEEALDLEAIVTATGRLAIANPKTAPYGEAARAVLENLGLWQTLQGRLIRGENIGQTFQFVASGNAPLGLVAHTQVLQIAAEPRDVVVIPVTLYPPLDQQAVLLKAARNAAQGQRFLTWLRSNSARTAIAARGYALP